MGDCFGSVEAAGGGSIGGCSCINVRTDEGVVIREWGAAAAAVETAGARMGTAVMPARARLHSSGTSNVLGGGVPNCSETTRSVWLFAGFQPFVRLYKEEILGSLAKPPTRGTLGVAVRQRMNTCACH